MKYSESNDYYEALIRRGSAELTVLEKKEENRALRDLLRRAILMRVFQG
jgi:hypothetical protein